MGDARKCQALRDDPPWPDRGWEEPTWDEVADEEGAWAEEFEEVDLEPDPEVWRELDDDTEGDDEEGHS